MDKVKFHFDPRCPWCYQTSRWAVRLEELGTLSITWAIFCLDIVNAEEGTDLHNLPARDLPGRSGPPLRCIAAMRNEGHGDLIGAFYTALGKYIWETEPPEEDFVVASRLALEAIGLDPSLCDRALADSSTWVAVIEEHTALIERTRSFGVPTIVLDEGHGPAIFGPVISKLPSDDDAVELWKHVSWLARFEDFSELKRDRTSRADLPAVRWRQHQRELDAQSSS